MVLGMFQVSTRINRLKSGLELAGIPIFLSLKDSGATNWEDCFYSSQCNASSHRCLLGSL